MIDSKFQLALKLIDQNSMHRKFQAFPSSCSAFCPRSSAFIIANRPLSNGLRGFNLKALLSIVNIEFATNYTTKPELSVGRAEELG